MLPGSSVISITAGFMPRPQWMTYREEVELIFKLVAVCKAVWCAFDVMLCDVKEREGCNGKKKGRLESKREREREGRLERVSAERL